MDTASTSSGDLRKSKWLPWAVLLAVVAVGAMIWSNYSTKQAIREVLRQDNAIPPQIMAKAGFLDKYWDGSKLIAELVAGMDMIDVGQCPTDFQIAYKEHVAAWRNMAQTKSSQEGWNGFIKGFLTGGLGVLAGLDAVGDAQKLVQSTWKQVQVVASRHGVSDIPK